MGKLDTNELSNWLWDAASRIRGPVEASKYKDYIQPLIFIKRLSDVFEDEMDKLAEEYGDREITEEIVAEDHDYVRVYIPPEYRWDQLKQKKY
ncbi:MAG: SAM-dependent DNA methyltransferase [Balneolaceae bacterium]|nr:SAM-dependent DNA methyltransferase [Balneolaceae bacterium]